MWDFLIITIIILIITRWLQSRPFFWSGKGIPWKIPYPFLGNSGGSLVKPFVKFWMEFSDSFGDEPLFGFHHFSYPALLLKDPELIKKVTITDADHFEAREFHTNPRDDVLARSLFFVALKEWKEQRAKMTPYFTPSRIKAMVQFLHPITDRLTQYLGDEGRKGPVEVHSTAHMLATDVVMSTIFGLKPESFDNSDSFFYKLQKEMISFSLGVRAMIGILAPNLYDFFHLKVFSTDTMNKLKYFTNDIMNQREKGIGVRQDFMQGMMELNKLEKDISKKDKESTNFAKFDRDTVAGQCMLMYVAGTETTGNNLSFLLLELALNPDIQDRCRQEINAMIKRTSGQYSFEDINKLTYVDMVLSESLRKYPPVSSIGRTCTKEYELNGLKIPVGARMLIPIMFLHRSEKYFPDPYKFDPERFNPESGNIISGSYIPFGVGPRTCIGMRLAQTEIFLSLIKVLQKFRISPCRETVVPVEIDDFSRNPTLSPAKPILLNFTPL